MTGRSGVERQIRAIHEALEGKDFENVDEANAYLAQLMASGEPIETDISKLSPERRAQELVYSALEAEDRKKLELARAALELDPLCTDALLILAQDYEDIEEARPLVERAVEAGRKSLPPEYFSDPQYLGRFWSIIETRPFMRALAYEADMFYLLGELERAIDVGYEMLDLNPNDNQGVRYDLAVWLVTAGQDAEALDLMNSYGNDISASFPYLRALIAFRASGDNSRARKLLGKAFDANPYVLDVIREEELPAAPMHYGVGDYSEAVTIARSQIPLWAENGKFVQWMSRAANRRYPY